MTGIIFRCGRKLLSGPAVALYWILNLTLLGVLLIWVGLDSKFSQAARLLAQRAPWIPLELRVDVLPEYLSTRVNLLHAMIIAGFVSAVGLVLALFFGIGSNRSLRAWLAVMVALAAWLTFYTAWPDYAWRAQAWRVGRSLPVVEQMAQALLKNWPSQDGQLAELGPFSAYPLGRPRTLLLLTTQNPPGTNLQMTAIERGQGDDLYFQLSGSDEGVTLARLPDGKQPHAYFSGLEGEYQPFRYQELEKNWFLVQYLYAPIIDTSGNVESLSR